MNIRITITGTESTGKSTLSERLSLHYKTTYVPDYSRYYIDQLNHPYNEIDVLSIARGIIEQEDNMSHRANRIIFSDNDLINIKIWLQYYKWQVPNWLENEIIKRKSDLYLLCDIDLPWIADNQRKNANDRIELFSKFGEELSFYRTNFKYVTGSLHERTELAIAHIDTYLNR